MFKLKKLLICIYWLHYNMYSNTLRKSMIAYNVCMTRISLGTQVFETSYELSPLDHPCPSTNLKLLQGLCCSLGLS